MKSSFLLLSRRGSPALLFTLLLTIGFPARASAAAADMPHLARNGQATQLMVDGQPFLVLGGELHNSSSTSRAYMQPIWPQLAAMNLNTVLAVVPWDMVEPAEGRFDFTMVDELLEDARKHDLKLVLLWFGSWKNGLSHYVPDWVKADHRRFPRARTAHGTLEILSTLSEANREADAKAFAALMAHLRQADGQQRTVIMIQVQNEVGLHADTRDRNEAAEAAFAGPVPRELLQHLQQNRETLLPETREVWAANGFRTSGTWTEVFGAGAAADEFFMAWNYSRYVNRVAEAGKSEYALPMFVNAWIVQPSDEYPGEYPAGGPQAHVLDIWRAGSPAIDIYAPDIYLPNFAEVCAQFVRSGNPLFVPESAAGIRGAANAFVAIGRFAAIGYSPFGIESRETDSANGPIHYAYGLLEQLTPLILEHQAKGTIQGVSFTAQNPNERIVMGNYTLHTALLSNRRSTEVPENGYGIIMQLAPDEFLVAGAGLQVTFATNPASREMVGLATVEEGTFENGEWKRGRVLNGDEIMISYDMPQMAATRQSGTALRLAAGNQPKVLRVKLYQFP